MIKRGADINEMYKNNNKNQLTQIWLFKKSIKISARFTRKKDRRQITDVWCKQYNTRLSTHISDKGLVSGKHTKNSYNLIIKGRVAQIKNGQRISIDISLRRYTNGQINTWKDVQHHITSC